MRRDALLIVLLGSLVVSVLAWTGTGLGNPGLDGVKCAPADVDPAFSDFACYNLYNKGQLPTEVVVGQMYVKRDGTTLDIHVVQDSGSTDFDQGKVCLDDDADINSLTNHCSGAPSAGTTLNQGGTFGGSVGTVDCSAGEESSGIYEFFIDNVGSALTTSPTTSPPASVILSQQTDRSARACSRSSRCTASMFSLSIISAGLASTSLAAIERTGQVSWPLRLAPRQT